MPAAAQRADKSKKDKDDAFYDADDDFFEVRHKNGLLDDLGLQFGGWSTGLCDCWLSCVPNGCMSTVIPCVALAQITSRINMMSYCSALAFFLVLWALVLGVVALEVWEMYLIYVVNDNEMIYLAGIWVVVVLLLYVGLMVKIMRLRTKVRMAFRIPGNVISDFCLGFWCPPCTIAQMASHVQSYQQGSCRFGPPDTLPAYF